MCNRTQNINNHQILTYLVLMELLLLCHVWFVILESSVCAPLLIKDMEFEAFVLSAVFTMDQSVCCNVEKSLKHWKLLYSLNKTQNKGKLHSAAKLHGHVCSGISLAQYLL